MSKIILTADEFDLLKELVNVAMGLSASELAELFDNFVKLKVPTINIESSEDLPEVIISNSIFPEDEEIISIREEFSNGLIAQGKAIIILNQSTKKSIIPILGLSEEDIESEMIMDFLLELSSQLIGSCLSNLFKQFNSETTQFSSPKMLSSKDTLRHCAFSSISESKNNYEDILCAKIEFIIANVNFECDLFILFDSESLPNLKDELQIILKESY